MRRQQERARRKVKVVRRCHEKGGRIREEKIDQDGCGREKERKTEAEVDGQGK